ncbi:hypothetical protein PY257_10185, partial [Ramlibacter sp. H39-3-26]|uniref:hypothetical protein n=1 Tax=Curvibacter soli TaxID=3031331 RepID=UPI0023DA3214
LDWRGMKTPLVECYALHTKFLTGSETAVEPTEKLKKPNIHASFQRLRVTAEQFQMGESGKHGNSMRDRQLLEFWGFNCRI